MQQWTNTQWAQVALPLGINVMSVMLSITCTSHQTFIYQLSQLGQRIRVSICDFKDSLPCKCAINSAFDFSW